MRTDRRVDGQTLYRLADPSKLSRYSLSAQETARDAHRQPVNLMRPHLRLSSCGVRGSSNETRGMLVDVLPVVTALEWCFAVLAEFTHYVSFRLLAAR